MAGLAAVLKLINLNRYFFRSTIYLETLEDWGFFHGSTHVESGFCQRNGTIGVWLCDRGLKPFHISLWKQKEYVKLKTKVSVQQTNEYSGKRLNQILNSIYIFNLYSGYYKFAIKITPIHNIHMAQRGPQSLAILGLQTHLRKQVPENRLQ